MGRKKIWTRDAVFTEAANYKFMYEFAEAAPSAYVIACTEGWLDQLGLSRKRRLRRSSPRIWTLEAVKREAKKYDSKGAFQQGSKGAHQAAWRNGWLDQLGLPERKPGKWTYEAVEAESKRYKNRTQFMRGSGSACAIAYARGWINDFFPKETSDTQS